MNSNSGILKSNKYNCKNVGTEQMYPGLRHPWIVFGRHWTKIAVLFASFNFEASDFPLLGLRVWAVTSAVTARFSSENIFGFDIPTEAKGLSSNASTLKGKIIFPLFLYFYNINS